MKILVTGGTGYIGSHTTLALLEAGHDVVVVDNLANSSEESLRRVLELTGRKASFHHADLLDEVRLGEVFDVERVDAVIHFAGLKAVGESVDQPLRYYYNNVSGTLNLLRAPWKRITSALSFSAPRPPSTGTPTRCR
jgi:UDP-glucose 4-epimerase